MKIARVVPIERGTTRETLSYFTAQNISPYSLVKIPIRGKAVFGIAIEMQDVALAKSEIKTSSYPLKKISRVGKNFLLPEFLEAASLTAEHFAVTTGSVLSTLLHTKVLDEYAKEKGAFTDTQETPNEKKLSEKIQDEEHGAIGKPKAQNKFVLQEEDPDRYSTYRSMIREQFAEHASVFLVVPRVETAEKIYRDLARGIEEYTFLFHSRMPWTKLRAEWERAKSLPHPILLIGTPSSLSLPRQDIGLFILEEEHSSSYHTLARPFFDVRYFVEQFAEKLRAKFIAGSSFLRIETLWRYEERELLAREPLRFRLLGNAERKIIDVKKGTAEATQEKRDQAPFRIISPALEEAIRERQESPGQGNVFLYGVRRGLAPETICRDCGNIVLCERCSSPAVLHRGSHDSENIFLCHKCGAKRSAMERCRTCESWRLESVGIGIESCAKEVEKLFPHANIFELHSDTVKDEGEARAIAEDFSNSRGGILVGTEKALPYLPEVALSGIVSLDPLFLIPDFRMRERALRSIFEIYSKTTKSLLIQTRRPEEEIFSAAVRGDIMEFYRSEIRERKRFSYPPFSTLVKISWSGREDDIRAKGEHLRTLFAEWEPRIFPAFTQKIKNRFRIIALIKIPHEKMRSHGALKRAIFSLTPDFQVEVEPKDLL